MRSRATRLYQSGMTVEKGLGDWMSHPAIREYLKVAVGVNPAGPADVELLTRFAATRDESAFELLVWRHAALVQRVCRSVLRDHHAAEDATQAAFLVLARKAHTFTGRGSVVGWLYRVARRIAVRLAKDRARRPATSEGLDRVPGASLESQVPPDELTALCAEVDRLPERYRVPVLLCFFEGLTHAEAARRTGWPVGSVAGRLARAKDLLARRLSRKGIGLASIVLAIPAGSFVGATARAGAAFAARNAVIPGVEPCVARLAEGALKIMTATTWKLTAAAIAAVCMLTIGVWGFAASNGTAPTTIAAPPASSAAAVPAGEPEAKDRIADAKQRAHSQNNLKQIVLAIHNYESANGNLPGNVTDADGKLLLSWRVLILPYIEQENLYKQFKLDEPWDSENNKKLLADMPELFKVGIEPKDATKTYYQGFAGPGTIFEPGQKLTFAQIPDGTSNTIAVVEAGPSVEWTKPADLPYDPKKDRSQARRAVHECADGRRGGWGRSRAQAGLGRDDPPPVDRAGRRRGRLVRRCPSEVRAYQGGVAVRPGHPQEERKTDGGDRRAVPRTAEVGGTGREAEAE